MRIVLDVKGYYDWVPVPSGTKIEQADVAATLVKQMSDERWYMRVEKVGNTHHDVGIHEEAICRRMASLERIGGDTSREQVVVELLRESLKHHLHNSHIVKVDVFDDGPDADMYEAHCREYGMADDAVKACIDRYIDQSTDLEAYLSVVLKVKAPKKEKDK